MATRVVRPKIKYKSFTYRTQVEWLGNRAGRVSSEGKPEFRVSSPPEFKGEADVWSPEDLFVTAVNVCTMTTFMALAERLSLPVVSYASAAEGVIEFVDGAYRFTRITLRPTVAVDSAAAVAEAEKTLREAHSRCLITNSIHAEVALEPRIVEHSQG